MSIAKSLGVDDIDGLLMISARTAWHAWVRDDPELAVVDDLRDLPTWLRSAAPTERDGPMSKLAALAASDGNAAVAMAWLLIPGAKRLGFRLRDLADDIDGLIAGQLWVEIRTHGGSSTKAVALTILRNVERGIQAEYGVGDYGARSDKTWAMTHVSDAIGDSTSPASPEPDPEAQRVLRVLLEHMLAIDLLTVSDVSMIASAASHADWLARPFRGRAGVTSPDALEVLTWLEPTKARNLRRYVGKVLDRIANYVRSVDLQDLLDVHADDGLTFDDWVMGLGNPRTAAALRRFREWEVVTARAHALSWDPEIGQCAIAEMCPACVRASFAA